MDLNEFAQNISNLGGQFYTAAQNPLAPNKTKLLVSSHFVLENVRNLLCIVFEN